MMAAETTDANKPEALPVGWATSALFLTGIVAVVAKIAGVVVAPGLRGTAAQSTIDLTDTVTAALAYTLSGLLVALVCAGSFELARAKAVPVVPRALVVALSGLVVALASPAVVSRLIVLAALVLAVLTSALAVVGGVATARGPQSRMLGVILGLLGVAGFLRPVAWEVSAFAVDRGSLPLANGATIAAATGIVLQAVAMVLALAWLGTRSAIRGRILANAAIIVAFAITYFAVRETSSPPGTIEAVLRGSVGQPTGLVLPYGFSTVAAFLVPASILLAAVALVQKGQPVTVIAPLSLALLSGGAFDVPLQALAVVAATQWAMLGLGDPRAMWADLARQRAEAPPRPFT